MGIPAFIAQGTVTLHITLAQRGLEELWSVSKFAFSMSIRTFGAHLALPESELLADLGFLEVWRILELLLTVRETALLSFCAVALQLVYPTDRR